MSDLMTSRFPTMRDAGMPLPERINAAIDRIAHGNGHMRVPVEATDPDIVLGDCRVELEFQAAEIADLKRIRVAVIAERDALRADAERDLRLLRRVVVTLAGVCVHAPELSAYDIYNEVSDALAARASMNTTTTRSEP